MQLFLLYLYTSAVGDGCICTLITLLALLA